MPIEERTQISFTNDLKRSDSAEVAILNSANNDLGGRAADAAVVRCTSVHMLVCWSNSPMCIQLAYYETTVEKIPGIRLGATLKSI